MNLDPPPPSTTITEKNVRHYRSTERGAQFPHGPDSPAYSGADDYTGEMRLVNAALVLKRTSLSPSQFQSCLFLRLFFY